MARLDRELLYLLQVLCDTDSRQPIIVWLVNLKNLAAQEWSVRPQPRAGLQAPRFSGDPILPQAIWAKEGGGGQKRTKRGRQKGRRGGNFRESAQKGAHCAPPQKNSIFGHVSSIDLDLRVPDPHSN